MLCIICDQDNWLSKYGKLKQCKYCGLVRADDRYFQTDSKKIYTDEYFNGLDYLNYSAEEVALKHNFNSRIKLIKTFKKTGKLLDIGCAYGYFLEIAKQNKYLPTGIELNKQIAGIAEKQSGCKVLNGDFAKLNIKKNSFDIITMLDTIEHFKSPEIYVKKAKTVLKNGGVLVIETGNIEALLPKLQKEKWRLITPPTHLYYFSKHTLRLLLEKEGYKVQSVVDVGFFRTIGQTIYRLTKNKSLLKYKLISNLAFQLYTFDLMFIVAQK